SMRREYDQPSADGSPGMLTLFRNHFLVRMVTTVPPGEVHVEPLGVQNWAYEGRSYSVTRNYRITTPEAVVEFAAPVMSVAGEAAGERRKWFLPLKTLPTPTAIRRTTLGDGVKALRGSARNALAILGKGELPDPVEFARVDQTPWAQLALPEVPR